MKTLISLIPDSESVSRIATALQGAGIGREGWSVLSRPVEVWKKLDGHHKLHIVIRYGGYGALLGLAVGALYGVPAGIMNCTLMDCTVNTSLVFLAVISLFWVLGGAFLGVLAGLDRLEQDLYSYVEGVRRGGAFILVDVPENRAAEVQNILHKEHGLLIHDLDET